MEAKAKKVLQKFANNTSLHGAPRIVGANTCSKRLLWSLFFCTVSVMLAYNLTQVVMKYLAFEKSYHVDMRKDSAVFPWITFCQHRAFDIVTLNKIYWLFSYNDIERRRIVSDVNFDSYVRAVSKLYDDVIRPINNPLLLQNYTTFDWHSFVLFHTNLTQGVARFEDVFMSRDLLNWYEQRLAIASRTVRQCFTNQFDLQKFLNTSQGFELHPLWETVIFDGQSIVKSATAAFRRKVSAVIEEIFGSKVDSQGVDIYIHPPGTDPEFEDKYIRVLPGQVARIYISPRGTEKLGKPYGEPCSHDYQFEPHPLGPYVEASCFDVCIMLNILKNCACKSDIFTLFNLNSPYAEGVPYCRSFVANVTAESDAAIFEESHERVLVSKVTQVDASTKCASSVWFNKENTEACKLACPRACVEYTYKVDSIISDDVTQPIARRITRKVTGYVARLELTNQNDRLQLFRRHANGSHSNGNVVNNRKESLTLDLNVRRALAREVMHIKFDIKVKDLAMAVTSEHPDYTVYQLLSDIGGQLGLSVITVLDIVSLDVGLTKVLCARYKTSS
jgi:hypothetical protein